MHEDVPAIRVVAAVISSKGRYLITQRRPTAVLPMLWEFPGGRVEPGETNEQALRREVGYRLDVQVQVGEMISFVRHPYERYRVELYLYECRIVSGEPREANVNAFDWVLSKDLDRYAFTPADEASMATLLGLDG